MTRVVYLDHHATTPVAPEVFEAMKPYFLETFGNPASRTHRWGWEAEAAVTDARAAIADRLGALPDELVFTSGATESINLALLGLAHAHPDRNHIVATAVEHRAVLDTLQALSRRGLRVELLPVDACGMVSAGQVAAALTPRTLCACVLLANNEIGSIHELAVLSSACRARSVPLLSDASQAVGHIPVNVDALGVDLMTFSAHKFHGPKGVGGLYVRTGVPLAPILFGGGHERGLRPGTLNVPGIVGMAAALNLAAETMPEEAARVACLRDRLQAALLDAIPCARVNGHPLNRLPGNLNMSFLGVDAEAVLIALTDVALSTGSACTSAKLEPSHVLRAIGLSDEDVHGSIRFGLGRSTTVEEIDYVVGRLVSEIGRLRRLSPQWEAFQREARQREAQRCDDQGVDDRSSSREERRPALAGRI